LERQTLQQDIVNLENSADIKIVEQLKKKNQELSKLLDDTVNLLGKEEIKSLGDIQNLLKGNTLKELTDHKTLLETKIKDQDQALLNLARSKIKGKKDAETLLNEVETNFSQQKTE
jgi:hypothetical protein